MADASSFDFGLIKTFYHISPEGVEEPAFEMEAEHFLNPELLGGALDMGGATVQATSRTLPASFVGTTLGKLLLTQAYLYAMYESVADLGADNLIFQVELHDDHAHLGFRIKELRPRAVPVDSAKEWLNEYFSAYVQSFLGPAVEAVADAASIKPAAIWQQYGGMLEYMREYLGTMPLPELIKARFELAFNVLTGLAPDLFGARRNPFVYKPRYCDNPYETGGGKLLMQSSCCLYDQRQNGKKCYTCPMLTPEQREERRKQIVAELAAG